ncbi:hypothetical protein U5U50_01350 [Mycoplasma sp. 888]|uniref:hypothetical protein n=1 Tax=Mycoplasma sp. 888 TaxID=3108483 RepID=UPI002D77FE4D|nr:hypothetical protein [Mycoplasma sp. 888]WRQ26027.1 hypothetical protein U5U50_01350 [Mycoplasma sp. 888]
MQKKFLSVPILVLSILFQILIFIQIVLSAAALLGGVAASGAGANEVANAGLVGATIGTVLISLLISGIGLALYIMQIIATVRIHSENKTIMVLYIVGFFVPIFTLIAASMAIHKKLY